MRFTNKYNLPSPMVKALTYDNYDYENAGDISNTALIMPPRIRQLKIRHSDQIEEDVSDRIWVLLGNMGHVLLEWAEIKNALQEERLPIEVNGWKVTTKMDLYESPATLSDYKITSVWSVIFGKKEWEQQLNIGAYVFRETGFEIDRLQIVAILRDWSKTRAQREPSYPQCAVQIVPIPIWPNPLSYIEDRVTIHQMAEKLPDNELPFCTSEERWEKSKCYAVMKNNNKKAIRLFEDPLKAQQRIKQLELKSSKERKPSKYWMQERQGESVRCEHYCNVQQWCNQYQQTIKQGV